ncbi:MAG: hypothetical protein L3J93_00840 [Thermoplasmata archaeon]|nr:hypothetical protein [Thermoplasmata archaeon]
MGERWPGPTYEIHATFRAPLGFVYRWCTDYRTDDARLEGETYERKILHRSRTKVVYEDLQNSKEGWWWAHHDVRLDPPDHWRSDSVGSHRAYSLDYRLSERPGDRTELVLRARRRPYGVGENNPPKGTWERNTTNLWKNFGRNLEKDYTRSLGMRRRT